MATNTRPSVEDAERATRLGDAAELLLEAFGPHVELEYLAGKTAFRDALYAKWKVSLLEAEELCEALERGGLIAYHEAHIEDEESAGWNIQTGGGREVVLD